MKPERIEALITAHVSRSYIQEVGQVFDYKWWDYRRLAPGHSFMLFAHTYYRHYRLAARKLLRSSTRDHRLIALKGKAAGAYTAGEIWDRSSIHLTGMWKAMLTADALSMPYDTYCELAMRIAIDTAWSNIPQPNQIYSDKMGAMIYDEWLKIRSERLFCATHPIYRSEYFMEDVEFIVDYREWIIDEIKDQDRIVPALASVVYDRKQIPEELAEQHFPLPALQRAKLIAP